MPLKLNVGLSKKIGQPDFGSLGATCHVEVELDSALLQQDLNAFHRQVRSAYVACAQAVNDELDRHQTSRNGNEETSQTAAERHHTAQNANQTNGNGNTHFAAGSNHSDRPAANGHGISQKQIGYIHQLARQIQGLGVARLDILADQMLGKRVNEFSSFEASAMIDQLKAIKAGEIDLADVLADGVAS